MYMYCKVDYNSDFCDIVHLIVDHKGQRVSEVMATNKRIEKISIKTLNTVRLSCGNAADGNVIKYLPAELLHDFNSKKLTTFSLTKCFDFKSLEGEEFHGGESLTNLSITETMLSIIAPESFCKLSKLGHLDLSNNNLMRFKDEVFNGLLSLKVLKLSHNLIIILQSGLFKKNTMMSQLYMNGNNLKNVGKELFDKACLLRVAYFEDNICISENFIKEPIESLGKKLSENCNMTVSDEVTEENSNYFLYAVAAAGFAVYFLLDITASVIIIYIRCRTIKQIEKSKNECAVYDGFAFYDAPKYIRPRSG